MAESSLPSSRSEANRKYHAKKMEQLKATKNSMKLTRRRNAKRWQTIAPRAKRAKLENTEPTPSAAQAGPSSDANIDPALLAVQHTTRPDSQQAGPSSDANVDPLLLAVQNVAHPDLAQVTPSSSGHDSGHQHQHSSPLSSPPHSPHRSASVHSPRPLDFVSGIRGVQVPDSAETVVWPGGLTTIVPTLVREDKITSIMTRHMSAPSRLPNPTTATISSWLCAKASPVAAPVVVRNFEDTSSFTFTEDGLRRRFGISPNMLLDIHDTALRVENFGHPQVRGTMSELIAGINDPTQCRFVLDVPLTQCGDAAED
ncbi:hypothetical protein J3R83DRAFT_10805 [Lanmaoa asiatica]|nr:hypothetical protein J3R83DRAFT_10805 [Lanmaoa asiatica]